jgi:hypothetical protein
MQYDSLNKNQRRLYRETVEGSHHRRVELVILTLDDKVVRSLTNRFAGGQVDTDTSRSPAAILQCRVIDDDHVLDWDHGEHRRFKAQVIDSRFVPGIGTDGEWVEAVVFTGPLWDFSRDGALVELVAQDTERLAMGSVRQVFTRPRKARATAVIRDLLNAAGAPDRLIKVPSSKATLPERVTVGIRVGKRRDENGKKKGMGKDTRRKTRILKATREDTYLGEVIDIAVALDRLFYADTRGRFVVRAQPKKASATLTNRHILAPVTTKRSADDDTVNTWEILGADPKGPKKQIKAMVAFPKRHPLSAEKLAWHNKPHALIETVENKHLKTRAQAVKFGTRLRDRAMGDLVSYEVQALPMLPWLQQHMGVSVPTDGGAVTLRATQWSFPLGPGADPMTLGANRHGGGSEPARRSGQPPPGARAARQRRCAAWRRGPRQDGRTAGRGRGAQESETLAGRGANKKETR